MIKVYLSSTFQDLKDYRQAVLQFFGPLEDRFLVMNMEKYVAESRTAYDKCMKDVSDCDIYLLIVGNSYGSIAKDPANPTFNEKQLSYTELEFLKARECKKETLIFKASKEANLPADDHADRLKEFWERELENKLRARDFDSPLQLALQVAQSITSRFIKGQRVNEKLVYLCDRVPQNFEFMKGERRAKCGFRAFTVLGKYDELCGNFVNRMSYLRLSVDEAKIVLTVFENFITSAEYENSLQGLLDSIYEKFNFDRTESLSIENLLLRLKGHADPLVLVINCDSQLLEETQIEFLKHFLQDCFDQCSKLQAKPFYFFLCIEEEAGIDPAGTESMLKVLLSNFDSQTPFFFNLPRLQMLNKAQLKQWLKEQITPDEGTAQEIMDLFFKDLPVKDISMQQAHQHMRAFITKMNADALETQNLINLY